MTRTELATVWPPTANAAREAEHNPQGPLQAIREKCRDCSYYRSSEIRLCDGVTALSAFRATKHPWRAASRKPPFTCGSSEEQAEPEEGGLPSC